MLSITDFNGILAEAFFDGNATISGLVIFSGIMLLIFVLIKKRETAIIMMIPVSMIFGTLGILSTDLMVILIAIAVLILAYQLRDQW